MHRNDCLIFDDINTLEFGVGLYGDQLADPPERDREYVSVPGRDGDLIIDNGRYKNITLNYKAYIIKDYNVNIRGLRNALNSKKGYKRLEDSINVEEYRMAEALPFEVDEYGILRAGELTISFNCKPQRFLKSGEQAIEFTAAGSIHNEYMPSKPLIRAYGTGSFTISGVSVQITTANEYTDIDCELMEAYKGSTNCNGNIVLTNGTFPVLNQGDNSIGISGLTRIEITPRWWIL